jgi:hypothetical protein
MKHAGHATQRINRSRGVVLVQQSVDLHAQEHCGLLSNNTARVLPYVMRFADRWHNGRSAFFTPLEVLSGPFSIWVRLP